MYLVNVLRKCPTILQSAGAIFYAPTSREGGLQVLASAVVAGCGFGYSHLSYV